MRPTLFEWNVWRAMSMINHGDIQGNFIVDDSGLPISTASGGQSDIVGDYGDFRIGIEVTLSTGKKQYEMEGEPVSRHIGEMQRQKPSFGL
ncbi:AlwI family type II restriction endonuclease, partial [Enterococcus faecalis]